MFYLGYKCALYDLVHYSFALLFLNLLKALCYFICSHEYIINVYTIVACGSNCMHISWKWCTGSLLELLFFSVALTLCIMSMHCFQPTPLHILLEIHVTTAYRVRISILEVASLVIILGGRCYSQFPFVFCLYIIQDLCIYFSSSKVRKAASELLVSGVSNLM